MWQSIPGTSCSTKRTCGQTISRISDVNQHLVFLHGHRSRHNLTKKWGMIFGSKQKRKKKIADSPREVNLVEESLTPTSVCSVRHTAKKGPVVAFRAYRQWRMPPGVPPETMDQDHTTYARGSVPESYWNHLRFRMVSIYKLDGVCIPPKLHQSNQKRKVPSALESFQSQQISSQLNMSTYGKRQSSQTAWGPTKKPRDKAVASWKCNKGGDLHPNSYMLYAKKTALVVK